MEGRGSGEREAPAKCLCVIAAIHLGIVVCEESTAEGEGILISSCLGDEVIPCPRIEEEVQIIANLKSEPEEEGVNQRIYHLDATADNVLGR